MIPLGSCVRTKLSVIFGDGSIVPKGTCGKIVKHDPAITLIVHMVETEGYGLRGFDKQQLEVIEESAS